MADMLVKLYPLPTAPGLEEALREKGITIVKALAPDMSKIIAFTEENGHPGWADEIRVCFTNQPVSCWIAVKDKVLSAANSVGGALGDLGKGAANALKDASGAAADALKDASGAATDTLKDAGGAATDALKGAGDAATDALKSAGDGLKGLFGK
jgi:hypothetical protein